MSRGLLIIGTDTECGKTVLAGALTAALRNQGLDAGYTKPVGSSGVEVDGALVSPDALWVARTASLNDPWELINPVCLPGEMSPLAAAEATGLAVPLERVKPAFDRLLRRRTFVLAEGVGGLHAPLDRQHTASWLVKTLGCPVLVAARPGLGTINHTLLTLEALDIIGARVLGFVYTSPLTARQDPSAPTNARHTMLFTRHRFLGGLPFISDLGDPGEVAEAGGRLTELIGLLSKDAA